MHPATKRHLIKPFTHPFTQTLAIILGVTQPLNQLFSDAPSKIYPSMHAYANAVLSLPTQVQAVKITGSFLKPALKSAVVGYITLVSARRCLNIGRKPLKRRTASRICCSRKGATSRRIGSACHYSLDCFAQRGVSSALFWLARLPASAGLSPCSSIGITLMVTLMTADQLSDSTALPSHRGSTFDTIEQRRQCYRPKRAGLGRASNHSPG